MKPNELKQALTTLGFRAALSLASRTNECDWCAYRNIASDLKHCECNEKQPQLIIEPHYFNYEGVSHDSCEFRITGERGGTWFSLTAYGVKPDDVIAKLSAIEASLSSAWNAI